jgi:hypothetical protein
MIQPAPESAVAVAAEGPTYERLVLISDADATATPAVVFLKCTPADLDSNSGDRWSSIALLAGEIVDDFSDYASRVELIADTVKALAAKAAASRKKAHKAAAEILHTYVTGAMANYTADDYGPVADECDGAIWGASATADGLAGEVGDGDSPAATDVAAESPTPLADSIAASDRGAAALAAYRRTYEAASNELAEAGIEFARIKETHKTAKERFEAALDNLTRIAERGPERMPLFDGRGGDGESSATQPPQAGASEASESDATADTANTIADANAWRKEPIESLGLPPKLADRLEEAGISTIGELEDKRAAFNGLRGISGIGPAKVTVIEDAVIGWLSKNRDAGVLAAVRETTT